MNKTITWVEKKANVTTATNEVTVKVNKYRRLSIFIGKEIMNKIGLKKYVRLLQAANDVYVYKLKKSDDPNDRSFTEKISYSEFSFTLPKEYEVTKADHKRRKIQIEYDVDGIIFNLMNLT